MMKLGDGLFKIQAWLCVMDGECYTAEAFTSGLGVGSNRDRWQAAVDTLHRLFQCGLIYSPTIDVDATGGFLDEYKNYVIKLSQSDPFDSSGHVDQCWYEWDICGSKKNHALLAMFDVHDLHDNALSEGFSVELVNMFEGSGLPFDGRILIPIHSL